MRILGEQSRFDCAHMRLLALGGNTGLHPAVIDKKSVVDDAFYVLLIAEIHGLIAFPGATFTCQRINFHLY